MQKWIFSKALKTPAPLCIGDAIVILTLIPDEREITILCNLRNAQAHPSLMDGPRHILIFNFLPIWRPGATGGRKIAKLAIFRPKKSPKKSMAQNA